MSRTNGTNEQQQVRVTRYEGLGNAKAREYVRWDEGTNDQAKEGLSARSSEPPMNTCTSANANQEREATHWDIAIAVSGWSLRNRFVPDVRLFQRPPEARIVCTNSACRGA